MNDAEKLADEAAARIQTVWSEDGNEFWWVGDPADIELVMARIRPHLKGDANEPG